MPTTPTSTCGSPIPMERRLSTDTSSLTRADACRWTSSGYGPEEFSLRRAKPGTYKVEANFYGHRQQVVAGATTLQVKLTTGFGAPGARERTVTLRLKGASEVVYVGDFEVR